MTIGVGYGMATWWRDGHPENIYRGLDEIAIAGFDGVEIYGVVLQTFADRPELFRRLLELHGLELTSVYSRYMYLDPSLEKSEEETLRRVSSFAAECGSKWLVIDGGHKPNLSSADDVSDDDVKKVADTAQRFAQIAKGDGLSVSWHQSPRGVFEWPKYLDRFMELTDPDLINFCPDTAQLTICGYDVAATFERYITRIKYVHFKDIDLNRNWEVTAKHGGPSEPSDHNAKSIDSKWRMVELGRGQINFPLLFDMLQSAGFDGWIVDDMDYTGYPTLDSATTCRNYLRDALGLCGRS